MTAKTLLVCLHLYYSVVGATNSLTYLVCRSSPSLFCIYNTVIEGLAEKASEKGIETTRECYEHAKSLKKDRKRKRGDDEAEDDEEFDESKFEKDGHDDDAMEADDGADKKKKKKTTTKKKKGGKKKKSRSAW